MTLVLTQREVMSLSMFHAGVMPPEGPLCVQRGASNECAGSVYRQLTVRDILVCFHTRGESF